MSPIVVQLTLLASEFEGEIWRFALVFLRIGAAVALLPALGEGLLPARVRLAMALLLCLIVTPAVTLPSNESMAHLTHAPSLDLQRACIEVFAGLMLGASLRFALLCLQTAGTLAAQSLSLAQMFNGTGLEPQPIISNLFILLGLVLFCTAGGATAAVEWLVKSYDIIPIGHWPDVEQLTIWAVARTGQVLAFSFSLAAPFFVCVLLYNLALGAINRAMPMLMVILIGAPALSLGGLVLLAMTAPLLLQHWRDWMLQILEQPFWN